MAVDKAGRADWIVGGLALLLVIDLLELPWHTLGGGTISGISLPSISDPATGPPAAFLGVLAVLASLGVLVDLLFEHLSPQTHLPAIRGNRSYTRFLLAIAAAAFLGLKFLFHVTQIGNLGVGFWLGALLAAGLVYTTMRERRDEPPAEARTAEPRASGGRDPETAGAKSRSAAARETATPPSVDPPETSGTTSTEASGS